MNDDYWKRWKNGKHDNRYRGVKSHSGKKGYKVPIIISVIVVSAILGFLAYQTYGIPQSIQNEANKVITNTENKIHQISPQLANLSNSQTEPFTLSNQDNRIPIAIYDKCESTLRTDQRLIETTCNLPPPGYQKDFTFNMPAVVENALYNQVQFMVITKVYQYGSNDFKVGLYDQVGEKNYTVTLWQLP